MSERDLVRELKENIKELTQDRDDALAKVKTKERLLEEALERIKALTDDSTEKTDPDTDDPELD